MRIAITGQVYLPGDNGQSVFTIHLAEGLAGCGHEVLVIATSRNLTATHEVINGVHLHKLRAIGLSRIDPKAALTLFPEKQICKIFSVVQPDVVHVQDHWFISLSAARMARKMNIPLIGTNHFLPENLLPNVERLPLPRRWKIAALWRMMLSTYNDLDLAVTPTETAARRLREQKLKIPVVSRSNGVDTRWFHNEGAVDRDAVLLSFGLDPKKDTLLYVGRLDMDKRLDVLIRGLRITRQSGADNVQLALAGRGNATAALQALAESQGISDIVHFLGYIPDTQLPLLYRAADIFGMPSPVEAQSIATLEAMASGLPILAAGAGALPELVATGENGFLFQSENPASLAEGIAYLAARRSHWGQMGKVGRAMAEQHDLKRAIGGYEELYSRLIDQKNGSRAASSLLAG